MLKDFVSEVELAGKFIVPDRPMDIGFYWTQLHPGYEILKITKDEKNYGYCIWYKKRENPKEINLTLYGQPITKKNSMLRTNWGGIIQSKAYREYAEDCRRQIDINYKGQRSITDNVLLSVKYYMKTKRYPDLLNLLQATCDIISDQKKNGIIIWHGIIADDKQIVGFNHSRIAGVDKDNPRAEIKIISIAETSSLDILERGN